MKPFGFVKYRSLDATGTIVDRPSRTGDPANNTYVFDNGHICEGSQDMRGWLEARLYVSVLTGLPEDRLSFQIIEYPNPLDVKDILCKRFKVEEVIPDLEKEAECALRAQEAFAWLCEILDVDPLQKKTEL
jgi:hypothetical protein